MTSYSITGRYSPDLDVRLAPNAIPAWLSSIVELRKPKGVCWVFKMNRRSGKTWLAEGIAHHLRAAGATVVLADLREQRERLESAGLGCLISRNQAAPTGVDLALIDEPSIRRGRAGPGNDPAVVADGIRAMFAEGTVPVLFATPAECEVLLPQLHPESDKDASTPPVLNEAEVQRLVSREPSWATQVVQEVLEYDPQWLSNPFLLELLLSASESMTDHGIGAPHAVVSAALLASQDQSYLDQAFWRGLGADHRAALRSDIWAQGRVGGLDYHRKFEAAGLDPIIADHCPPLLRIHHVSDLHHGGWLRDNLDQKDTSNVGSTLAQGAGAGTPLDAYLQHLSALKEIDQAPHVLVVTGDIVNRPNADYGSAAIAWLEHAEACLSGHPDLRDTDPRVLLVGGNHDVSWDLVLAERASERHDWFAETFAAYPHPDLHVADHGNRRTEVRFAEAGIRFLLLGSAEAGGEISADDDRELAHEYEDLVQDDAAYREFLRELERSDPGLVAKPTLDRLHDEPGMLTIAALHHPISDVPYVEVAPYVGIVNAGQAKAQLIRCRAAAALHGHTHQSFFSVERQPVVDSAWALRVLGAPSLASAAADERNGYNEILVRREGSSHQLLARLVEFKGGQWDTTADFAFKPGETFDMSISDLPLDSSNGSS